MVCRRWGQPFSKEKSLLRPAGTFTQPWCSDEKTPPESYLELESASAPQTRGGLFTTLESGKRWRWKMKVTLWFISAAAWIKGWPGPCLQWQPPPSSGFVQKLLNTLNLSRCSVGFRGNYAAIWPLFIICTRFSVVNRVEAGRTFAFRRRKDALKLTVCFGFNTVLLLCAMAVFLYYIYFLI